MSTTVVKTRQTVALVAIAALLAGCGSTYRYRLGFASNPHRAEAEACWQRCKRSAGTECLAKCPGVQRASGACKSEAARVKDAADCVYWNHLLNYQSDDAGRARIQSSMPPECVAGAPQPIPAPAPVCRDEFVTDTPSTFLAITAVGGGAIALVYLVGAVGMALAGPNNSDGH